MEDSDGFPGPKSKSKKPKKLKPRKGKKPLPGDKMSADDDIPFEDNSEEDDIPSDDIENGPKLKDKKKPRKKRPGATKSRRGKDDIPDDVSLIHNYCY